MDNGSPPTVAGAASELLGPVACATRARFRSAAAPNSLFAGLRRHLCRSSNQPSGPPIVNVANPLNGEMPDFPKMSGKLATASKWRLIRSWLLLGVVAAGLAGCAFGGVDDLPAGLETSTPQSYPTNYRPDLLAFMKTYLNDPRGVRAAMVAEPVQRTIGARKLYTVCLRYNARDADGRYAGPKERLAVFIDGRLDRLMEEGSEECHSASYASFPEMEKLTR